MPINVPDLQIFMQAWHINFAQTLKYRYFTKYQCARSANLHADLAHFCINYSIQLHRIDVWTCNKLCKQEATALFQVLFQCHQYASQRLTAKCAAHPRDAPLAALLDALLAALLDNPLAAILAAPLAAPLAASQAAPFADPLAGPLAAPLAALLAALIDNPLAAILAASQAAPFAGPLDDLLDTLLDTLLAAPLATQLAACYIYIHQ